jgi:hypothetical protein
MIIRQDLQQAMGMDILFSSQRVRWNGIEVPMQTANSNLIDLDEINSTNKNTIDVFVLALSTMKIFDAKYEKADLDAYFKLLNHLEHLFDGSLQDWKTDPVDLRLKSGEIPFQLSPFPVPKIHKETLKKEINRLYDLGVLKPQVASKYQSLSFIILKKTVLSV